MFTGKVFVLKHDSKYIWNIFLFHYRLYCLSTWDVIFSIELNHVPRYGKFFFSSSQIRGSFLNSYTFLVKNFRSFHSSWRYNMTEVSLYGIHLLSRIYHRKLIQCHARLLWKSVFHKGLRPETQKLKHSESSFALFHAVLPLSRIIFLTCYIITICMQNRRLRTGYWNKKCPIAALTR